MTATPSTRFLKMNWLNFHYDHCSKSAKNTFETVIIGDSIVAGLSRYQNVRDKFLKPLKALNCDIGGDRIEHVLWRALNLPASQNLKNVVVLCGTNNLLLDSPKDIADGILEITRSFEINYSCVNVIICGILACDDSWSVNRVSIKKINQILKLKCCESSYTFVSHDRGWALADGSLVEKGNLKLAESIFNSIEVSNDSNHNNKFSKSYKMAVSFKLNNAEFLPLPFPSTSKPVSSISASLPFITACTHFPRDIINGSFAIVTNKCISSINCFSKDNFFPKLILNSSQSPITNLACNIPIKHNQQSACKSVHSFQPVVVNLNVASVPVRHRLHIVKSVLHHQRVFCLAKPIFLTVDIVTDTPNVRYVTSTHNVRKVFPSTHNSVSIPTQVYCPKNNNNIANSHLPFFIRNKIFYLIFDFKSMLFRMYFLFT